MSRTFAQIRESGDARDYITQKKTKYTFCSPNQCHPNKNIYSQSNYLLAKSANNLAFYPCSRYNKNQLYINLYTKLDLIDLSGNTPIISDLSGNTFPVDIDIYATPYLKYNIDPSGVLFGNNICGLNNYKHFVKYDIK